MSLIKSYEWADFFAFVFRKKKNEISVTGPTRNIQLALETTKRILVFRNDHIPLFYKYIHKINKQMNVDGAHHYKTTQRTEHGTLFNEKQKKDEEKEEED